jgi:hypothetical protein
MSMFFLERRKPGCLAEVLSLHDAKQSISLEPSTRTREAIVVHMRLWRRLRA